MGWHRCDECGKKFAFQKSLIEHQVQAKHNPISTGRHSASLSQQAIRHPEVSPSHLEFDYSMKKLCF